MIFDSCLAVAAEVEICVICRVGNSVAVAQNNVFDFKRAVIVKSVFNLHCEIAAEAVLTVGRKALKCNAVVVCVVNLPRCKAESAAAVKCPCALIFRSVVFDTLECEFCIADSVCPSADNKALIAVVGIFVCLRIVKAEHNIRQIAVFVRHLY